MRLIDADELERKVRWYGGNTSGLIPHYELINAPTVNAIPIEWIEDYIAERSSMSGANWSYVKEMLDDWEKENEIN